MGRLVDWPTRLNDHIEEWRHKKFEWGKADCALFCLYAEKAICGSSRFDDFIGKYRSAAGSARALLKIGAGDLAASVGARLREIKVLEAQRGDVALIDTPLGDALSLVVGDKVAAMGKDGLIFLPLMAAKKAWKV
jgi:hypothetical protein